MQLEEQQQKKNRQKKSQPIPSNNEIQKFRNSEQPLVSIRPTANSTKTQCFCFKLPTKMRRLWFLRQPANERPPSRRCSQKFSSSNAFSLFNAFWAERKKIQSIADRKIQKGGENEKSDNFRHAFCQSFSHFIYKLTNSSVQTFIREF